jgi:hypothetical protein
MPKKSTIIIIIIIGHLGDPGVHGRIILIWISRKCLQEVGYGRDPVGSG